VNIYDLVNYHCNTFVVFFGLCAELEDKFVELMYQYGESYTLPNFSEDTDVYIAITTIV